MCMFTNQIRFRTPLTISINKFSHKQVQNGVLSNLNRRWLATAAVSGTGNNANANSGSIPNQGVTLGSLNHNHNVLPSFELPPTAKVGRNLDDKPSSKTKLTSLFSRKQTQNQNTFNILGNNLNIKSNQRCKLTLHQLLAQSAEEGPSSIDTAAAGTDADSDSKSIESTSKSYQPKPLILAPFSPPTTIPIHAKDNIFNGLPQPDPGLQEFPEGSQKSKWLKPLSKDPNVIKSKLDDKHYRIEIPTDEEKEILHRKAMIQTSWKLHCNQNIVYSDGGHSEVPETAHWLFIAFLVLEAIFLGINIFTTAPFVFEKAMPYHLSYTTLGICWWAASYVGLDIGRYPGYHQTPRIRSMFGVSLLFLSVGALLLADTNRGREHVSPWPSYLSLISIYGIMQLFDFMLLKNFLLPTWLYRWKTAQAVVVQASLITGVWKGKFLEDNCYYYMEKELESMGDPLENYR